MPGGLEGFFDAMMSGDTARLERELFGSTDPQRRRNLEEAHGAFSEVMERESLPRLLRLWLANPHGQHDPPADGAKGDLIRWFAYDGARMPTIRRDVLRDALEGKVTVRGGQELFAWLVSRLDATTRKLLISMAPGLGRA